VRHLRRHDSAPGAALRALHRQFQLRPAGGGIHRVRMQTTPFFYMFCYNALLSVELLTIVLFHGKMQALSQGQLCCHLHSSPVSPFYCLDGSWNRSSCILYFSLEFSCGCVVGTSTSQTIVYLGFCLVS
jgi:hypothetical protein